MAGVDLTPRQSRKAYGGEGGVYCEWSPADLPMLGVANIGAAKLSLAAGGLSLPSYSDSAKVAYVLQGTGTCGIVLPEATKEKVVAVKEGDALALPFGVVTWWHNAPDASTELLVLFLGDTSKGHKPGQFTNFQLTGATGIFTGFSTEFVGRAWDLAEPDAAKLVSSQPGSALVKLPAGGARPSPPHPRRTARAWRSTARRRRWTWTSRAAGAWWCSTPRTCPWSRTWGWAPTWSASTVTYIVRGSGRVQVVGPDGVRELEARVEAGVLFIVPRFFVVSKIADEKGLEWFSIITTPDPVFSHLAGKTSVWKAISPQVLQAAFNTTPEMEQLFRSKRLDSEIFFAPPPSK